VGKFSAIELRNLLAGKVASASPSIGELEESLSGSASPKDLDTVFQLIYLRFTAPRADPTVFANMAAQLKAMLANAGATPNYAFSEALQTTLSQGHLRGRMASAETVDQWNLDKSLAFYKDRFADAGDFTFIFVGTFTPDVMRPLVEKYLASLPSTGRKETWKDVGMAPPKGVVEKTVKKGIEPQSQTAIVFTGPFQYDQAHRIAIRSLVSTLDTKLRETLREDLSGTYGVSVSPTYGKFPAAGRRAGEGDLQGNRSFAVQRADREAGERGPPGVPAGHGNQLQGQHLSPLADDREVPERRGPRRALHAA
jgi:zinc protease